MFRARARSRRGPSTPGRAGGSAGFNRVRPTRARRTPSRISHRLTVTTPPSITPAKPRGETVNEEAGVHTGLFTYGPWRVDSPLTPPADDPTHGSTTRNN